jgi:hypothetical protein
MLYYTSGIKGYFYSIIISIIKPHINKNVTEFQKKIDFKNRGIIKTTCVFIATVPKHLKIDKSTYIFLNRILY